MQIKLGRGIGNIREKYNIIYKLSRVIYYKYVEEIQINMKNIDRIVKAFVLRIFHLLFSIMKVGFSL